MDDLSIGKRLLELEERSAGMEERFRKEVKKMMTKKLTRGEKVAWGLSVLLGAFFVVLFSWAAIVAPAGFPFLARLIFIEGVVFGFAWAVFAIWTVTRGSVQWLRHENATHGLAFGFLLLLLVNVMLLGSQLEDRLVAIHMLLGAIAFFMIFGIPALLSFRISPMERALREQLLKLELKVTELAETVKEKD